MKCEICCVDMTNDFVGQVCKYSGVFYNKVICKKCYDKGCRITTKPVKIIPVFSKITFTDNEIRNI